MLFRSVAIWGFSAIWESNGYSAIMPYLIRHSLRVASLTDAEIEGTFLFARPLPLDSRLAIGDPRGSQRPPRRGRPEGSLGRVSPCRPHFPKGGRLHQPSNGAGKSHTHSSYGFLRNFIIYIGNMKLRHLGVVIFLEQHTTRFYDSL